MIWDNEDQTIEEFRVTQLDVNSESCIISINRRDYWECLSEADHDMWGWLKHPIITSVHSYKTHNLSAPTFRWDWLMITATVKLQLGELSLNRLIFLWEADFITPWNRNWLRWGFWKSSGNTIHSGRTYKLIPKLSAQAFISNWNKIKKSIFYF